MKDQINIYCDESCHLQNDKENVMALGAISCPTAKKDEIFLRIAELKAKYNLIPKTKKNPKDNRAYYEIKWNKVSKSQLPFFKDVIDYFFDDDDISFRVLVVPDKSKLDYEKICKRIYKVTAQIQPFKSICSQAPIAGWDSPYILPHYA